MKFGVKGNGVDMCKKDYWEITEGGVVMAWTSDPLLVEELYNDVLQNSRYPSIVECTFYCPSGHIPDIFSRRMSRKEYSRFKSDKIFDCFDVAKIRKIERFFNAL